MTERPDCSSANCTALRESAHLVVAAGDADVRVEGDGEALSIALRAESGAWLRVHSQRNPRDEARRAVDEALAGHPLPSIVVLLGIGLGYVIDELVERQPVTRILAIELEPALLAAFCARRDWTTLLRSRQLIVTTAPGGHVDLASWPDEAFAEPPLVVVQPVIARARIEAFAAAHEVWQQAVFERRANAGARRAFSAIYVTHTLANSPRLAEEGDISALDGVGAGLPTVICAAGPSLDALLPDLARFRHRALVIAADTALRPLVRAGIEPDLVVAVDPTTMNGRHLVNLPRLRETFLVAEASVDPRALNAFAGRTFFARIGRFHPWPWLEANGASCGPLQVWGSVLTAACDLAIRLGSGPILLAGTDLAYTGGQPYCRHTTFEADWQAQAERDGIDMPEVWRRRLSSAGAMEPDVDGQPTLTAPHLVAFRNWVRAFVAAAPGQTFVNVSGAGILHGDRIGQASLADALGKAMPQAGLTGRLASAHGAMRPSTAALGEALEALRRAPPESEPFTTWAAEAHDLDVDATRRMVASAASRAAALQRRRLISSRSARNTDAMASEPEWIDVPYDAKAFFAKAPMEWDVAASAVTTLAYVMQGRTMTLSFAIHDSTLRGAGGNELYIRIPDGYLPSRTVANAIWIGSLGYREMGYMTTHPGLDALVLFRASEAAYAPDPIGLCIFGQITFEVQ